MIIYDIVEKGKNRGITAINRTFIPLSIVLLGISSYGIQKIVSLEHSRQPVRIETIPIEAKMASIAPEIQQKPKSTVELIPTGKYVAARGGKNYYDPWCPQVKRISDKNKLWFPSQEIAEMAGFKAVPGCKVKKTPRKAHSP